MTRTSKDNPSYRLFVGTYSAAAHITAAWMQPGGQQGTPATFDLSPVGIGSLQQHLSATGIAPAHTLVVPHTGHPAWLDLAVTLSRAGYAISPINPARARALAITLLQAGSSDTIDAGTLAHLAALLQPTAWSPTAATAAEVQRLLDERAALVGLLQRLEQQRPTANPHHLDALQTGLHTQLREMEQRLVGLLSNDTAWAAAAQRLAQLSDEGLMAALWQAMTTRTPQSFDLRRSASSRYLPHNPQRALLHFSRPFAIAALALALTARPALPTAAQDEGQRPTRQQQVEMEEEIDIGELLQDDGAGIGPQNTEPAAPAFRVNTTTAGDQILSATDMDDAGNAVVVWEDTNTSSNGGIYMKGYDSTGATTISETQIDNNSAMGTFEVQTPDVALDASGDFVVVWQKEDIGGQFQILAQRYNSNGTPNGSQITIAQSSAEMYAPAVAMDDIGSFVVTWDENYYGIYDRVYATVYDETGSPSVTPFVVAEVDHNNEERIFSSDVGMDDDGNFVVAWDEGYTYYAGLFNYQYYEIYAQRYTAAGAPDGNPRLFDSASNYDAGEYREYGYVGDPAVDMDDDGNYVIAWEVYDYFYEYYDGSVYTDASYFIEYRAIATDNSTITNTRFFVNATVGNLENPAVTIDDQGDFVVAVEGRDITSFIDYIFYQNHNAFGTRDPEGAQFVTEETYGAANPAVASDANGNFIVTWDDFSGSGRDVWAQFHNTINTPPIVDSGGTLNYTEGDGAVVIDTTVEVIEFDMVNAVELQQQESATVQITTNYAEGEDVLAVDNALLPTGITAEFNAATGTLSMTGVVSPTAYQQALQLVTYENTSIDPDTSMRTVTFTVSDGTDTGSDTRNINITSVNVPPTVTTTAGALPYTENDDPTPIDPNITVTDDGSVISATVEISGFVSGEDVLDAPGTLPGGISANFDAATGILTLSNTAVVTEYQAALRLVTYENTSEAPDTATRTVTFTVSDGADEGSATRDIDITAENDAPTVTTTGTTLSYLPEDGQVFIDPGLGINDIDHTNLMTATVEISNGFVSGEDTLTVDSTLLPSGISANFDAATGTLTLTGTATVANYQAALHLVTYENDADPLTEGIRTVTFTVYDPADAMGSDTRDIDVKNNPSYEVYLPVLVK